jgi:hypothetical protein
MVALLTAPNGLKLVASPSKKILSTKSQLAALSAIIQLRILEAGLV